jgi:DNA-binding CsgD family transcriptional regulator
MKRPVAVWATIGLGAMGIWMNLVGYSSAFAPLPATQEALAQPELSRYAFFLGLLACGLLLIVLSRKIPPIKTYLDFGMGVVMSMGTASFGIAYQQSLYNPAILATIGCFCSGIGYAWFVRSFYLLLATREGFKTAITCIAVSLLIESIVAMLLNIMLSRVAQVIVGTLMPPFACIILIVLTIQTQSLIRSEEKFDRKQTRYQIQILAVTVLSLLVIRAVTTVGLWGNTREDLSQLPLQASFEQIGSCLVLMVLAYFVLIRRSEVPLRSRYQMPLLIIAAGCLVYLINEFALPLSQYPLERVVIEAIELFGHLVLWTIIVASIKSLSFSPFRIMGATAVMYSILAIAWIYFFENSTNSIPAFVLVVVYTVAFFLAIMPLGIQETTRAVSEETCEALANVHGLTQREREVLTLLVQGRSRPYIQQKLHLADGTVKTHTSHIYAKLSIHTKQELLDLIEQSGAEEKRI